jgi:activating signal cointegrator complex subunit 1
MNTINSNAPNLLNAFKMTVKTIGGKLYRVNNSVTNMLDKNFNVGNENDIGGTQNVKSFKLVNLTKQMSNVMSEDDASSEDALSGNVSFLDEDEDDEMTLNRSLSINPEEMEDFENADVDMYMMFSGQDGDSTSNKSKITLMKPSKPSPPRIKWTHFLSIPFHINKEFLEKYDFFRKKIMEENLSDIDQNLFQRPNRLHMTICLFKIDDNKSINLLEKIIKESEEEVQKILDGSPLYLEFDQLEIMGNPNKTRVLYTRPHATNSEKFKDILDIYLNKFIESGLITEDMKNAVYIYFNEASGRYENRQTHVTLMNSTFLIRQGLSNQLGRQDSHLMENSFFNGMKVIKRMKNFSFGIHQIEEIYLNEMRIDRNTDTYRVVNKFKLKC